MRRLLPAFLLCVITAPLLSQPDTLEIDRRYGFKDIRLEMPVDSVPGLKFRKDILEKDQFQAKLYQVVHTKYATIGEVKVTKLEVKAYQGSIYEILVTTVKDTRLMKALESIYGKADFHVYNSTYNWKGKRCRLTFSPEGKKSLKLTYVSWPVIRKMYEDKGRKVEEIAQDF
jgi:hypothetical protein